MGGSELIYKLTDEAFYEVTNFLNSIGLPVRTVTENDEYCLSIPVLENGKVKKLIIRPNDILIKLEDGGVEIKRRK